MVLFADETMELLDRLSVDEVEKLWIRCRANMENHFDVHHVLFHYLKFSFEKSSLKYYDIYVWYYSHI